MEKLIFSLGRRLSSCCTRFTSRSETRRTSVSFGKYCLIRATCGAHARADLRNANCGPPPPPGCGPLGPDGPFPIRDQPAAERRGLHERTCGTRSCSPPPGGGCGLPVATRPSSTRSTSQRAAARAAAGCGGSIRNRKFGGARQRRQGAAGLRRRRLRPADPCGIESDGKALYSHQSHKKSGAHS